MTLIVGLRAGDSILMAADSQGTETGQLSIPAQKMYPLCDGKIVIGISGSVAVGARAIAALKAEEKILRKALEKPDPENLGSRSGSSSGLS